MIYKTFKNEYVFKNIYLQKIKDLIGHLLLVIVIENDGKYIYGIKKWHRRRIRNSKVFKIKIGSFYQYVF